uniref:Zinc finger protein 865 n=1 Tax=Neogobius melanostomus TaxID=47308 RepID=A0A8C6WHL6_9GOBI
MAEVKLRQHRHSSAAKPLHIKEEPELCIKPEPEEFPLHTVAVKTEDDEDKPSLLHQGPSEENRGETKEEESAEEDSEEEQTDSSDTDHSEDYCPQQTPTKRSYAMIPPDSSMLDRRPFSCSHCGLRVRWKSELESHMVVHTGEKPFKCSLCEKSYTQKSTLNAHMKIHSREKPHVCSLCEKGFHQSQHLRDHQHSIHHVCPVCSSRFPDDLDKHLKTHVEEGTLHASFLKPFSCSKCGKSFRWKSQLQKHTSAHMEGRHKCPVCERRYVRKHTLTLHMRIHTGEKPFVCSLCDARFCRQYEFTTHQKLAHCICPVCKTRFPEKMKLNAHLSTHVEEGTLKQLPLKFSCSDCGKEFRRSLELQRHMTVHTGERPFKCPFCQKGFTQKSSLNVHMRIHTGEKPHVCSVCNKCFHVQYLLTQHLRRFHPSQ